MACPTKTASCRACRRRCTPRASTLRSPMPACPATPPPTGSPGSTGRCRDGTDAVIVELGANDMLRGIKPEVTRDALDTILQRLTERHIAVLLCGMRAAPNLGADYGRPSSAFIPNSPPNMACCSIRSFSTASPAISNSRSTTACIPIPQASTSSSQRILPKVEELIAPRSDATSVVRVAQPQRSPHAAAPANSRHRASRLSCPACSPVWKSRRRSPSRSP